MAAKILLHLLAQQPSPAEQFSTELLKQICHTCAVALDVLLVLGVVVVLGLVFSGRTRQRSTREGQRDVRG